MNEETRRMEQFNDIVANIKPLMTVGKGKNQRVITGSAVVPLSLFRRSSGSSGASIRIIAFNLSIPFSPAIMNLPCPSTIANLCSSRCHTRIIVSIVDNAGWNKETNGYATFVMRALREVSDILILLLH